MPLSNDEKQPLKVVFRADAARHIGTGHVMRCLTLAREYQRRGATVSFISRPFEGNLFSRITEAGCSLIPLSALATPKGHIIDRECHLWFGTEPTADARETASCIPQDADLLIVDHYAIAEGWEKVLRPRVRNIMAIDDLANRRHDVDLLIDQNYVPAHESVYKRLLPPHAEIMCGPKYAILRNEFQKAHEQARVRQQVRNILVFFGGIDAAGETLKVVRALVPIVTPEMEVHVIIGAGYLAKKELAGLIDRSPGFHLHEQIANMSEFMSRADIAIGAGGTTTWERCAVGLPSLVVSIAENQRDIAMGADELGIVEYLGHCTDISATGYQEAIRPFLSANSRLRQISERARTLVDGKGAERVVTESLKMLTKAQQHVSVS